MKKLLYVAIGLLCGLSDSLGQYTSEIVPFDVNPNAENIQLVDGELTIRSINAVNDGSGTTLMTIDQSLNKRLQVDFENVSFSRDSPRWHESAFWAFAQSTVASIT